MSGHATLAACPQCVSSSMHCTLRTVQDWNSVQLTVPDGTFNVSERGWYLNCISQDQHLTQLAITATPVVVDSKINMFLLYVLAPLCIVGLLIRRLYKFRNYPDAPGPELAKYTRWWYLKKVYDGKFEQWDVDQHARHGMLVPAQSSASARVHSDEPAAHTRCVKQ